MQKTYLFILLASLCFLSFETQATVIFVDYSSAGTNTGASWTNAFTTLQPALNAASAGDSIFIAEGTYKPTLDPSSGTASGNTRDYAFYLDKDIKIYGGFAGTETALSQRDIGSNPVILSGDIGTSGSNSDNCHHIFITDGLSSAAVLDGVTITGGNANASSGSITYSGQTIEKKFGGGLYNYSSSPTLTNLTISGNAAIHAGGGLYNYSSSPTLTNVTISGNTASSYNGGGLYNYSSSPTLTNVTISGNTAIIAGGGIFNYNGSSPTITNTIFWGNKTGSSPPTTNVAGADIKNASSSTAIITYSLVQLASSSYTSGNSNLLTTNTNMVYATDPSFNDASDPDGADNVWMTADDGLNIINSPAYGVGKSSGAPSTDITGASRASSPSMGAYEGFITRYYVDIDATGTGAGTSWTNAYTGLQDAIDASSVGDEIWVAEGTYIPNVIPQFQSTSTDNRNKTFAINKNIAIYGGFDGTESVLSQRDAKLNITVLSGDLGTIGTVTDNCYHVVMTANLGSAAIIDGFTIQDGNANGGNYTNQYGGRNFARELGGGIASNVSSPTLSNLIIKNNRAKIGAGVSNRGSSSYLINLTFVDNIATEKGGGVANITTGSPSIINCVFSGNLADDFGGGIYSENSPTITNCTFFNNKATTTSKGGGGVYAINAGTTTVSNCIFFGNKIGSSTTNVGSDIKNGTGHTTTVDYSMVQLASGSYTSGNTNALTSATNMVYNQDPLFSGHGGPDGVDNVWMTEDDGLRLNSNSPAVDAGLNSAISGYSTDIVGTARVVNTNVNMGAYEVLCSETTETIAPDVCDSYTSPSGKTWTTSNTYSDTIANTAGCDSVITVNLTVRNKTTETIAPDVCDSYTSPSGKTWTTSNTYSDTIPNTAGCDSVITVNLTVRNKSFATISPDVCDSFLSPSGKTWTTSSTYLDTIANTAGCDSVITVNLTVRYKSFATISPDVCDSFLSPSGKTWTTTNTYLDTIPNDANCDSIITVNLTVRYKSFATISDDVCDSYTSPSGKTWTTTNTYLDTIPNDANCDSVITVNLTVRYKSFATISPDVCDSFLSPSGKTWTTSSTYMDTIPNDAGCDSVITVNLTVRNKSFGSLTANVCDSFLSPSGKTWTTSSTYLDTIANTAGCDSVITVNLTVRYKSFATISPDVCDSYISPSGKTWTVSNTYLDTIPNAVSCDSIITVNLTIRQKSFATLTISACDTFTSPSGKKWYTSDVYLDTISNDASCDSIMTFNITIENLSNMSLSISLDSNVSCYGLSNGGATATAVYGAGTAIDTIIFENFEATSGATYSSNTSAINNLSGWSYSKSGKTYARLRTNSGQYHSGSRSMALDVSSDGNYGTNYLVYQLDLGAYASTSGLGVSFWYRDFSDESDSPDKVWIRGSSSSSWIAVFDWSTPNLNRWAFKSVDIEAILASNSQTATSTFQIRFGQHDDFSIPTDGLAIDDLTFFADNSTTTFDYYWSNGGTDSTITGVTADTYTVQATSFGGCVLKDSITITEPPLSTGSEVVTAYETYNSPSGKTWTTSGVRNDTIINSIGCDSIITVDLTVINKLFVDTDGSSGTGKSWGNPMKTLDDAINAANKTDNHAEIWMRKGMYYPGGKSSSNRDSAFLITNPNVELLGGFAGTETEPGQRNQTANPTILCGDIGTTNDSSDNVYHVLIIAPNGSDIGPNFKLDGLTFKNGNADGNSKYTYENRDVYQSEGGSIVILGSGKSGQEISPTITNCHFEGNYGDYGSIYIRVPNGKSFATISHCTFKNNHSIYGAIFNDGQAGEVSPNIVNCAFDGNTSATSGAAIYNYGYGGKCSPTITSCVFNSNSASSMGGAIYNTGYGGTSNPVITNATFHANAAGSHAGAMYSFGNSGTCQPKVTNSIFYKNTKGGDDDHKFSEFYNYAAYPYIKNSSMQRASSTYTASTFNSLNSGTNNIFQTNPNFEAIADGNGADDVWRTGDDGLRLSSSSTRLIKRWNQYRCPNCGYLRKSAYGNNRHGCLRVCQLWLKC